MLVAETLAKVRTDLTEKNVMFVLFNGEAFDYIGSSRVVYDMQKGQFPQQLKHDVPVQNAPVRLEDIDFFIELSQLGLVEDGQFYLHTDPVSMKDVQAQEKVFFSSLFYFIPWLFV